MKTVKSFEHDGHLFEVRAAADDDGWRFQVFLDGKPLGLDAGVRDEVRHDAQQQGIDDLCRVIADELEKQVKMARG